MLEPLPTLVLLEDDRKGERIPIPLSGTRVGRSSDNDVVINDASVSRHHAVFHRVDGRFFVEDSASSGGTFVNDRRLSDRVMTELSSGDLLTFGKYRAQLIMLDEYDLDNDDDSRTVFMDPTAAARHQESLAKAMANVEPTPSQPMDEDDDDDLGPAPSQRTIVGVPTLSSLAADTQPDAPNEFLASPPVDPRRPAPASSSGGVAGLTPVQIGIVVLLGILLVAVAILLLR